jgi:hypothetical protein
MSTCLLSGVESRSLDGSGMVPNSPVWLGYWMRQFELMGTGEPYIRFTLEAARAVMNAIPDDGVVFVSSDGSKSDGPKFAVQGAGSLHMGGRHRGGRKP